VSNLGKSIDRALNLLRNGGVVAIPTETVYGLGGNGLSEVTVSEIFKIKNRPSFDPLILHTSSLDKIAPLVKDIPQPILDLAESFMPGPLSILVEKTELVPQITTSGLPKVAIRIPNHPIAHQLLTELDFPLAAPSANPFGYISPTTAEHVADQLGDEIPYILDGGPCDMGIESTIVDYRDGKVIVLRKGGIPVEDLEKVIGPVIVNTTSSSNPSAPGMLHSHYSPKIPLYLATPKTALKYFEANRIGVIAWSEEVPGIPTKNQRVLSNSKDFGEAARNLFNYMRVLDNQDIDVIIAELVPDILLGRAINDKLRRACAKS